MRLLAIPVPVPGPSLLLGVPGRLLGLLVATEQVVVEVAALLVRIEATRQAADRVVARVDETVSRADETLARLQGPMDDLLPIAERIAATTGPEEVEAVVAMVDRLPLLAERMTDLLPVLDSMASVAPDLHDLLDVSRELNEMLTRLPGMRRIRRKVDAEQETQGRG